MKRSAPKYTATVTRDGKWWMVAIPALDGLTQARRLSEAKTMAVEYIALELGVPQQSIDVDVIVDAIGEVDVAARLAEIEKHRRAAHDLERRARTETIALAQELADAHIPVRDIGTVLDVSFQRAHQLVRSTGGR